MFCNCTWEIDQNHLVVKPSLSDLDRSYRNIYEEIAQKDLANSIQLPTILHERSQTDFRNLGQTKGLNVLEIGPGRGDLTRLLVESGANVFIADLIPSYLNNLSTLNLFIIEVDAQNLTISDYFDLVIAGDVIEHVIRPADLLISINKSLKRGGFLYLRCPQKESLNTYSTLTGYEHEMVRLRSYTRKILRNEIMNAGFRVQKIFQIRAATRYLGGTAFLIDFKLKNCIGIAKVPLFFYLGTKFINLCLGQFNPGKGKARKLFMPILKIIQKLFTYSSEIAFLAKKI